MNLKKTGTLISEARKEQNLTQQEVADKLYVSTKTVSKWERGGGFPSPEFLIPLSEILHLSVNEILIGEKIKEDQKEQIANEITVKQLKEKKQKQKRDIIGGIILCICLCLLETLLTIGRIKEGMVFPILILVFVMMFLVEYMSKFGK